MADSSKAFLWGCVGFTGGYLAGAGMAGGATERNLARELDRAVAFAMAHLGPVGVVGTTALLDPTPGQIDLAFVLDEGRWYSFNAGAWLPDEETQAAFATFDVSAARTIETTGCHLL